MPRKEVCQRGCRNIMGLEIGFLSDTTFCVFGKIKYTGADNEIRLVRIAKK